MARPLNVEQLMITGSDELFAKDALIYIAPLVKFQERSNFRIFATVGRRRCRRVVTALSAAGFTVQRRRERPINKGRTPGDFWEVLHQGEPEAFGREPEAFGREPEAFERACRICGCTQDAACAGGCYWVDADVCSACCPERKE